ncbi:MAG: amino acid adenylation domain-containing protein, partial [Ignavibacteriae bacterium]|nr:amino acid adenylation domain-containing protein [Ignavibacteriota bacterium]
QVPTKLKLPLQDLPSDGYNKDSAFLPEALSKNIFEINKTEKITINTLIQAAWSLLLAYYTSSDDVVFGATLSGRNADVPGIEKMVGLFINTLPVRVKIDKNRMILDWLNEFQIAQSELQNYEHTPLFKIQKWSDIPGRDSLFNTILVLENYPVGEALSESESSLKISDVSSIEKTNYPLTFVISPGNKIGIEAAYDTNEFDKFAVEQILVRFEIILDNMIMNLNKPLSSIKYTSNKEAEYLIKFANGEEGRKYPFTDIISWFDDTAKKNPTKKAVICGEGSLTFSELNKKSNQVAYYLIKKGCNLEDIIGLCLNRSIDLIIYLLAINKVGAAVLPIDISYPKERINFLIEDSNSKLLITNNFISEKLNIDKSKIILDEEISKVVKNFSEDDIKRTISSRNLCYLIFTSGSTGKPKGMVLEHEGLCNFVNNTIIDFKYGINERILQFSSFGFDAAIGEIYSSLLAGGTLFIPKREVTLSGDDLANYIKNNEITFSYLPPSYLSLIEPEKFRDELKIACVGDKCSTKLAEKWGNKLTFYNGYGPTEATIGSTFLQYTKNFNNVNSYPIGKGFGNTRIYLLDTDLQIVPIGAIGELHISSIGVGRGYLNRADITAEKFIPDPFSSLNGERMYRTGDNARYLADGNIEFIGRKDFQVKLRGYRIELNEIDFAISQNKSVKDSIVVEINEEKGNEFLAAYIIKAENNITKEEILNDIQNKLPEFMIPKSIIFLDEFPLSPNGKIDRSKLPVPDSNKISSKYIAPKTSTEELIANIWSDILKIDKVGRNSNFFELGGHSLMATQLISRLRETFKKEIPFSLVFESNDLKILANQVDNLTANIEMEQYLITKIDRDKIIPLSYSQQRLWFLDQLKPHDPAYNIPTVLRLKGKLKLDAAEKALNLLIKKYEILRTSFLSKNGKPFQNIIDKYKITIENHFAQGDNTEDKIRFSKKIIEEKILTQFDLQKLPLFKCENISISEDDNILFFVVHHIIADGWSLSLLITEFISIYSAIIKNEIPILNDLEIQFADYAYWQQEHFALEKYVKELSYWKDKLLGSPPILELPYDKPKPSVQSTNCDKVDFLIEESLVNKLTKITRSENATIFMSLLSLFQFLLSKYSNMNDIVVGTPIAGRNNKGLENLVGFFVNNLAIRTKINKTDTFRDLLNQVRDTTLEAYSNQNIPFDKIVEELQPARDLSHQPIFQVMFVFQNIPLSSSILEDLEIHPFEINPITTNYDITFTLQEDNNKVIGSIDFNSDLFEKETIKRFADHYKLLINTASQNPEIPLCDIELLSSYEKIKILNEWNYGKEKDFGGNTVSRFEEAVKKFSKHAAIVYKINGDPNNEILLTYSELNSRSNKLAHYIKSIGVLKEERIAICMNRHPDMIIALFAILKSGCAFLPIDPSLPKDRIAYMLEKSDCKKIIINESTSNILKDSEFITINLDLEEEKILIMDDKNPDISIHPLNLAYVIFTSGSTGLPKGVMLNHLGLTNLSLVQKDTFDISESKRIMQFSSLSFDASVWETVMALLNGASLYLTSKEIISSGFELVEFLEYNEITTITLPPSVLSVLPKKELPKLKTLITAGEAISSETVKRWSKGRKYFNAYGPTETTVCATMLAPEKVSPKGPPIGKSIDNFETYVLDSSLFPVGIGIPGELCVGGIGLARGYINQPDLTADKFIPNTFSSKKGERIYRTGDLVKYLADGNIEYLGRIDSQVKLRGFRIEITEIENVIKQVDFVDDAAVIVKKLSDNQEKLIGYIICDEKNFNKDDIQHYLKDKLPDYMIPSTLVHLNEMPLTINGKVDKNNLPMPEISREELGVEYVAPRNEEEKKLVKIVQDLLSVEQVGIKDNFFELGGHSLLATQFISRIKDEFDREVKLIKIFEDPTIEGVIRSINNSSEEVSNRPAIQKISRDSRRTKRSEL